MSQSVDDDLPLSKLLNNSSNNNTNNNSSSENTNGNSAIKNGGSGDSAVKKEMIKKEPSGTHSSHNSNHNHSSHHQHNSVSNGNNSSSSSLKKQNGDISYGTASNKSTPSSADNKIAKIIKPESSSSSSSSHHHNTSSSSSPSVAKKSSSSSVSTPVAASSSSSPIIKKLKTEPTVSTPSSATKKPLSNGNSSSSSSSKQTNGNNKSLNSSSSMKTESKTPVKPSSGSSASSSSIKKEHHSTNSTNSKSTPGKSDQKHKPTITPSKSSSSKSTPPTSSSKSSHHSSSSSSKKRAAEAAVESESPKKRKKKEEEEEEVWRWWEEKKYADGRKWTTLDHKGPVFDPGYTPLPDNIHFFYDGERMKLSSDAEEVMTFYAKMLDHDYTKKDAFNTNFFNDWKKFMTSQERAKIRDLKKCDFTRVFDYFKLKTEERKNMTKEEKKAIKEENLKIKNEYGFCLWDNHKQPIGNYKIEPPGLFRGRGEHPKMGMVKKRIQPEDVIINCGKDSKVPSPPPGHKWKEVRHDNMVAWLASWTENVQGNSKYVMLNAASRVKGERDWQKYEKARKLHRFIDKIRENYTEDWKSKEMKVRQRAVAIYFIDKLALRAGNEKDEDEADTVGCCSLRVEHIKLHKEVDGVGEYVVEFDFLGKDSIRYQNKVAVDKRVYKNLTLFMENKNADDELFDRLNTSILNSYLNDIMEGLSAKVFRTYNASRTLQDQLDQMTDAKSNVNEKILSYNRANRAVAILCNHQRAVPKTFQKSMENMQQKIQQKKEQITDAEKELKKAKSDLKNMKTVAAKKKYEQKEKALEKLRDGLKKLEMQVTDKEENKDIALGTSKLNYLDPRISVAWCKKHHVPIEKIYSKTQRDKFRWAIDMATPEYHFFNYDGEIVLRDLSYLEGMDNTQETAEDPDEEDDEDEE